jgi:pyruvate dehydrogenase E2 component (dihydrolipoamide acetyltransferase)
MMQALTIPAWGMEDAPGTVVGWLVEEGAQISLGDELVEIETSKLTNVVESPFKGTLARIVLRKGDSAPKGALLAVVVDGEASNEEIEAFVSQNRQDAVTATTVEPTETIVETEGGRVRVISLEGGAAPPLMLLHGFGADWTNWSFISRGLAQKRTVRVVDLPGHGGSSKELGSDPLGAIVDGVLKVATEFGGKFHLAGHSLGGLVAVRAAATTPDKFLSVSLLAPTGLGERIDTEFLEAFATADQRKPARRAIEMLVSDPNAVSVDMINDVIRARRVEGAKEALHALRAAMADDGKQLVDVRDVLAALDLPVQVIVGENDRVVSIEEVPSGVAETKTVSGVGHLLHMEKAGEIQKLLEAFMERYDG